MADYDHEDTELARSLRRLHAAAGAAASDALRAGAPLEVVDATYDAGLRAAYESHERLQAAYADVAHLVDAQHQAA
jgi:hypothetical protein